MRKRPSVASLDSCRALYDLSMWDDTAWTWYCDEGRDDEPALNFSEPLNVVGGVGYYDKRYPAYDLGYLLRHLPLETTIYRGLGYCEAVWRRSSPFDEQIAQGETPEEAAVKLAIALFTRGLLPR